MVEIKRYDPNDRPDLSKFPKKDNLWNSKISNISNLGHVIVASCLTAAMDVRDVNLVIFVTPGTTTRDILNDWWQISAIRENVTNAYGKHSYGKLAIHQTAFRLHEELEMSYKEIAEFLNFEILVTLCVGLHLPPSKLNKTTSTSTSSFEAYLTSFGISVDEVKEWAVSASDELSQGKLPWIPELGPITRPKVREKVRQFRKKISDDGFQINRNADRLRDYTEWTYINERIYLRGLCEFAEGFNEKHKKLFNTWHKLREKIFYIWGSYLTEAYPEPPDVGIINSIFP